MRPLDPADPRSVGPYRLLGRLGAGGMGEVFLGRGPGGRLTAVKLIHASLAADPEFRRRFRREVDAARRVSAEWTAPVLESDTDSKVPWVATGYLPGPSLHQVVDRFGPLPEETVWSLAHGLARALTDIHAAGLVHRDLKPSNVLVTLDGPRVIDFGIARAADASMVTRTGSLVGSPGYMPPEQIRDEALSGAADVFALGVVLGFAATGEAPFSGGGAPVHTVLYRVVHEEPELGPEDGPLSGALRELVARCLVKDPEQRPSVAEVVEATAERGRAAVDAESGLWLPATLTSLLGREAAGLLALDGPSATTVDPAPATPPPPAAPPAVDRENRPTPPPDAPTVTAFGDSPSAPGGGRRRTPLIVATAAAAAVLAAALGWTLNRTSDDGADAGGSPSEDPVVSDPARDPDDGSDDGSANGSGGDGDGGAGDSEAPLHHLLPASVQESGVITVRTGGEYPPFFSPTDDDAYTGIEPDLAAAAGELLGVEFEYRTMNGDILQQMSTELSGGMNIEDIGWGAFMVDRDVAPAVNLDLVGHLREGWVLVVPEGGPDTLGELCGATFASWHTFFLEERLGGWSEEAGCASPPETSDQYYVEEALDAVASGQADAALMLQGAAMALDEEIGAAGLAVGEPFELFDRAIAVSSGQPEIRDALVEALSTLVEDGTYAEILADWDAAELAVEEIAVDPFVFAD
ncbi:serine/threonine-protein kinase [Streptomyces sedi]|uniref:Transporter substrate-binding domain-containing protein n=1 Tax=Streptomyces sedi TaxID=555059 RepID=A0A5C4V0U8_9ACTN|nr:serine/threonine-protein kinase [Streptomyces sedi]TNM29532.1 transporter substrate-binding domain-containing protein [Streptomyces sedi]